MAPLTHPPLIFIGGKQIGANCLRYLLKKSIIPALVVGNADDKGEDTWHESLVNIAKENNLPTIAGKKVGAKEVTEAILAAKPNLICCIGGTQLIPKRVLEAPKTGCLNIHPALLPKYRGRFSTVHAIFNGEKQTGVSAHWMDEGIDSGPLIMQEKMEIADDDTAKTLYDKFTSLGEKIFISIIEKWLKGEDIKGKPQDESKATYYPKGLPNNGEINWEWGGEQIKNFIRAMTFEPFPPASFAIGKKKMVVVDEKYFKGFDKEQQPNKTRLLQGASLMSEGRNDNQDDTDEKCKLK